MFFPIALAFHAKYDPEGSTWYSCGPLESNPATRSDVPKGRTPPLCVNSCITVATSRTSCEHGTSSWYVR